MATGNNGVTLSSGNGSYNYTESPQMVVSQNVLYFPGYTSATGWELYKYDVSLGLGITPVKDITTTPVKNSIYISISDYGIAELNGTVYFLYYNYLTYHYFLYKTDGTDAGTMVIKDFGLGYYPGNLYIASGKLYFSLSSATNINGEPWVSDGTTEGTVQLANIYPGIGSSPNYFTACNGKTLFLAKDKQHGAELFSDSGGSVQLVKDMNTTATASSYPLDITPFKSGAIMNAYTYETGYEPFIATATAASLLKDISPGPNSSYPSNFTVKGDIAYFSAVSNNNTYGISIFKTDGTAVNTMVFDSVLGDPQDIAVADNGLVYYAYYSGTSGAYQVWRTDGTTPGTLLLGSYTYINSTYHPSTRRSSIFAVAGNTVYFVAGNINTGIELYKSDGTVQGTLLVKDINAGLGSTSPSALTVFNGNLYFEAYDGSGYGLWKTDGTSNGTVKLVNGFVTETIVSGSVLYFSIGYNPSGNGLWKTYGTTASSSMVDSLVSASNLTDVNGTLYFLSPGANNYTQLWKSDGTEAGTQPLTSFTSYSFFDNLTAAGGGLFFTIGNKLWASDGTTTSTGAVADPLLDTLSVNSLAGNGSQLFLNGYIYQYGYELYTGDASQIILPVTLVSFGALLKGSDVITQWQTASETNTSYFNIQRSTDGIHFTDAGKVMAKGNSHSLQTYSFPDVNIANLVSAKTLYYRLQIVDKDGRISLSKTVPIDLNLKDVVVLLLPNPVKDVLKIRVNNYTGKAAVTVFDANGRKVYATQQTMQSGSDVTIPASALPAGVYMVKVSLNGKVIQQKFIKE